MNSMYIKISIELIKRYKEIKIIKFVYYNWIGRIVAF